MSSLRHWPDPRSLATTSGVSVDILSSRYLDVSVPWVCFLTPMYSGLDTFIDNRKSETGHPEGASKPSGLEVPVIEGGFPHSEILGSTAVRTFPKLIAAYHVLHRLLPPRHPPDALRSLDRSHLQCSPMRRATLPSERRPALLRAFGWMRLHRKTRSHKQTHTRDALAPIPDPSTHLARPKPCATSSWVAPASCADTQACFLYTMSSKPQRRRYRKLPSGKVCSVHTDCLMVEPVGIEPTT